MNTSAVPQTIGNICVGLAALIYAFPLQHLLWELSGKPNARGSAAIAGIFLLLPMWLLLSVAALCVTTSGGLDGLGLPRPAVHTLVVLALFSMTALSFMRFEFPGHRDLSTRVIGAVPIYAFPLATMVWVVVSLNPRLAPNLPMHWIRLPWLGCAVASLVVCGGYLGWRGATVATRRMAGITHRFGQRGPSDRELLARIAAFDPERDFAELLRRAASYESRAVREAATGRLRTHAGFVDALAGVLNSRSPEPGLAFLHGATLSPDEQSRLALPARNAMERFTSDIPAPNYITSERRKQLLRWGRKTLPVIAGKFSGTGVDFAPALASFEHALRPDDTRRR